MADESNLQPLNYRRPPEKRRKVPDDPESLRWRHRRIVFRLGLFILLSPFTFYFVPNLIMFQKWTRLAPADFIGDVQSRCVPVVRAIKEYQRDTGHFPNQIADLIPKYLASISQADAVLGGGVSNGGDIVFWTQTNHEITYSFFPGQEGWSVSGPFANGRIPLPPVTIGPTTQGVAPVK